MLIAATLASDTQLVNDSDGGWDIKGDPTEGALVVAAAKAGLQKESLDSSLSPHARNSIFIRNKTHDHLASNEWNS